MDIFLYFRLKELDTWPSKKYIIEYMPVDFSLQFPTTRVKYLMQLKLQYKDHLIYVDR